MLQIYRSHAPYVQRVQPSTYFIFERTERQISLKIISYPPPAKGTSPLLTKIFPIDIKKHTEAKRRAEGQDSRRGHCRTA